MGFLRFHVPSRGDLPADFEQRLLFSTFAGPLMHCQATWQDDELHVRYDSEDSCVLQLPWRTDSGSELLLTTATLLERSRPYVLPLELARGAIHRVACQLSEWEVAGHDISADVLPLLQPARKAFVAAVTVQHCDAVNDLALVALDRALELLQGITQPVTTALAGMRKKTENPVVKVLVGNPQGVELPDAEAQLFKEAFDTTMISVNWRTVEKNADEFVWDPVDKQMAWCRKHKLRVVAGPLIQFRDHAVPDWLYLWEENHEALLGFATKFAQQAAQRYRDQVSLWQVATGLNLAGTLGLDQENRLRLAAGCIDAVRRAVPQTPVMIGFQQPWGEYLTRRCDDFSPMGFADAILRANLGLSAIALELNFDVWPGGTVRRDSFELLKMCDQWSQFELPLIIVLTAPSSAEKDVLATTPTVQVTHQQASPATQAELVQAIAPLVLSHPAVQGLVWDQWSDGLPHPFPNCGLLDKNGRSQPALALLKEYREEK